MIAPLHQRQRGCALLFSPPCFGDLPQSVTCHAAGAGPRGMSCVSAHYVVPFYLDYEREYKAVKATGSKL
jgi:hypothetical protein